MYVIHKNHHVFIIYPEDFSEWKWDFLLLQCDRHGSRLYRQCRSYCPLLMHCNGFQHSSDLLCQWQLTGKQTYFLFFHSTTFSCLLWNSVGLRSNNDILREEMIWPLQELTHKNLLHAILQVLSYWWLAFLWKPNVNMVYPLEWIRMDYK